MPIYSYECRACGHGCERYERIADRHSPTGQCERCEGGALRFMGIDRPNIGREEYFGVRLRNGQEVRANLRQSAPKKRPVTARASDYK